jgi:signal transduction histidine kinase
MEEIFEPYVRLEHGREMHRDGSGLGLGIARGIVREHAGELALRNHPEGGLVVTVSLPRGAAEPH